LNKYIIMALTLALSLAITTGVQAETIYRWVDSDGVVHYSGNPPDDVDAKPVDPQTPSGGLGVPAADINPQAPTDAAAQEPEISYAEQRRQERREQREKALKDNAERERKCAAMRQQRAALEPSPRVIIRDENGNPVRMNDEDRLAKLDEAKKYLQENCQ
jgi:PAS domain-containing protein